MDPLSITTGCVALAGSVGTVVVQINAFCRQVRDARRDLDLLGRELGSLKMTLDIIADDLGSADVNFPPYLEKQIADILNHCGGVVEQIRQLLEKHRGGGLRSGARWAISGKDDMDKLRVSLEAHKSALELALEVITLSITKDIKNDTTHLRADTGQIIEQTEAVKMDTEHILAEIERLRLQLEESSSSADPRLKDWLDSLTSYADSEYGDSKMAISDMEMVYKETTPPAAVPSTVNQDPSTSRTPLSDDEYEPSTIEWKARLHPLFVKAFGLAFSPDSRILASVGDTPRLIRLFNTESGAQLKTLQSQSEIWANKIIFSPDGKTIALITNDNTVEQLDISSGAVLQTFRGHSGRIWAMEISPNGSTLASTSFDNIVKLWDTVSGKVLHTLFKASSEMCMTVAFSADGKKIASASLFRTIQVWDADLGTLLRTLSGHSETIKVAMFLPGGSKLASASIDGTIKLWDTSSGALLQTLFCHTPYLQPLAVAFSPHLRLLAFSSSGDLPKIQALDIRSGATLPDIKGQPDHVVFLGFSPDGKLLASCSENGTVRLWDALL